MDDAAVFESMLEMLSESCNTQFKTETRLEVPASPRPGTSNFEPQETMPIRFCREENDEVGSP